MTLILTLIPYFDVLIFSNSITVCFRLFLLWFWILNIIFFDTFDCFFTGKEEVVLFEAPCSTCKLSDASSWFSKKDCKDVPKRFMEVKLQFQRKDQVASMNRVEFNQI